MEMERVETGTTNPPHYQLLVENNDRGKPCEDAKPRCFAIGGAIFALIADGVTRSVMSDGKYPRLSPARMAADTAIIAAQRSIFRQIQDHEVYDWEMLAQAVKEANEAVAKFNLSVGITPETTDYGCNDLPATTLTVASIQDETLCVAAVADSPIWVLTKSGGKMITEMQCKNKDSERRERKQKADRDGIPFDTAAWQIFYRKKYRNNPKAKATLNGDELPMGYGALTGEPEAVDYFLQLRRVTLPKECWIMVGSDGCAVLDPDEIATAIYDSIRPELALPIVFAKAAKQVTEPGKYHDDMSGILIPYGF